MRKKSSGGSRRRIPPEHGGIQVNFCKNPDCENYGVPAAQTTGRGAQRDRYAVVGASRQYPALKCRACGACVDICEFHAPELTEHESLGLTAQINASLCKGCGTCASWCPSGAIVAKHFTDRQVNAMIDAFFDERVPVAFDADTAEEVAL